jgi:hypothetical protein
MNNTFKTILIVLAVLLVAGGLFFAGQVYGRWQGGSQYGYGYWGMPMMGGYGIGNAPQAYGPAINDGNGYGRGPMTFAPGASAGVGGGYGRGPMMGGYGYNYNQNIQPLTIDEAKQAAQKYVDSLGISDLGLGEVMIFDNNAYVVVEETGTGTGAFELLVDPVTKVAYPEHGANVMWNLKYGGINHGGMMGYGWNSTNSVPAGVSADMTVTPDQAVKDAQDYLDKYLSGATAATDPVKFYGYYTIDFSKDGKIVGMLSVNGYSGAVFVHTWHGTFIEEAE